MSVIRVDNTGVHRYRGLSTDSKPTTSIPEGSTFFETDTQDQYEWLPNQDVSLVVVNSWQLVNATTQKVIITDTGLVVPFNAVVTAYVKELLVREAPCTLRGLSGYNSKGSLQYIQLHNVAGIPADGVIPEVFLAVQASSPFTLDYGYDGRRFSRGLYICNSSTLITKTVGSADCWFDVQYREK